MPDPKALTPFQARSTLVHRFGRRVDRLRQIPVKFGLRPYRTFLVWFRWSGLSVGEGDLDEIARVEILPTPELIQANTYLFMDVGRASEGTMKLLKVSPRLAERLLLGDLYMVLGGNSGSGSGGAEDCPASNDVGFTVDAQGHPLEFYYMAHEDGRSQGEILERWYRLQGQPYRVAGRLSWNVELMRIDRA